jgi:hypothetical protein
MSSAGWMSEKPAAIRPARERSIVMTDGRYLLGIDFGTGGARRGIMEPEEFPLMRHLHSVVGLDEPLDMPWPTFFGGEPESKPGKG